jgi:hypothetical protein
MVILASVVEMGHHTTAFQVRIFRARLPCIAFLQGMTRRFLHKHKQVRPDGVQSPRRGVLRRRENQPDFQKFALKACQAFSFKDQKNYAE